MTTTAGQNTTRPSLSDIMSLMQQDVQLYAGNCVADQKAADQAVIDQITAQFAEYKLEYPPVNKSVFFGANVGGIKSESPAVAFDRINKAFGGLDIVRWWENKIVPWSTAGAEPAYFGKMPIMVEVDLAPKSVLAGGAVLDSSAAMFAATPTDRHVVYVIDHEMDQHHKNGEYTVADIAAAHGILAKLHRQHAPSDSHYVPLLTGGGFITDAPTGAKDRRPDPSYTWRDYFPQDMTNIDGVGADCYQHGQTDATADSAATILQPVIDAAESVQKPIFIGELGARQVLSDAAGAKFLTDFIAMVDKQNARTDTLAVFDSILYYESYLGSLGPWSITNGDRPLSLAVYRNACMRH